MVIDVICAKCGSDNVIVQIMQEEKGSVAKTKHKFHAVQKKHGFLWWLLIGWWWWIFDLMLWVAFFPFRAIYALTRKKKYKVKGTSKTVQRNKIVYKKICTCQNCGHVWQESV